MTSDALEEWHRYCLPRSPTGCAPGYAPTATTSTRSWPGRPPPQRAHLANADAERREDTFAGDVDPLQAHAPRPRTRDATEEAIRVVDLITGEIRQEYDDG